MHSIQVAADVYDHLRQSALTFEDESAVLRRLLHLPTPGTGAARRASAPGEGRADRLVAFLGSPRFAACSNVTDRYLAMLSRAYQDDPARFEHVLALAGRTRKYFGKNRSDITSSGKSTHPQQIPDSPYWAMTNTTTRDKEHVLSNVLRVLEYDTDAARVAVAALR